MSQYLDPQEQLPPIHPEKDQPEDQQDGGALGHWGEGVAEEFEGVRAKMRFEGAGDEAFPQVRDAVGGDGVHADDHKGEGEPAMASHINEP